MAKVNLGVDRDLGCRNLRMPLHSQMQRFCTLQLQKCIWMRQEDFGNVYVRLRVLVTPYKIACGPADAILKSDS